MLFLSLIFVAYFFLAEFFFQVIYWVIRELACERAQGGSEKLV
jgi:hypothetical protein